MPTISFTIPLHLKSIANGSHGHWKAKAFAKKRQREVANIHTIAALLEVNAHLNYSPPYAVTITRIGKRQMDDDNIAYAAKAVRDGIAEALGVNDGDRKAITFQYAQEIGTEYGVRINIQFGAESKTSGELPSAGNASDPALKPVAASVTPLRRSRLVKSSKMDWGRA